MSKPTFPTIAAHNNTWWQHELAQVNVSGLRWLSKHYPTLRHIHEDLISESAVQIAEHLLSRQVRLPQTWFEECSPPADDVRRFHGFVLTVLKRRVMDQFRNEFRQWTQELSSDDASIKHTAGLDVSNIDLDSNFDLNRSARALLVILARMSPENRLLMEEVALGGRERPYEPSERQRIRRLRSQLLKELTVVLGSDPMKLLR